ncbi:MAG: M48 family metallopeptidase [Halieaceae bacterium]|nr:M48 family metallopeptidase [Halieaceae bacterium]
MKLCLRALAALLVCTPLLAHADTQAFDAVAATNALLAKVPADDVQNTIGYVNSGYVAMVLELAATLLIAWLLLSTGWSRRWRELAERKIKSRFAQAFIYMPIYLLVSTALFFPVDWFSGHYIEQKYGLGNLSFGGWLSEHLTGTVLIVLFGSVFLSLLYVALRRSPERWWIWGAGLSGGFLALLIFLSPLFIDPLFNDYKPMDEGPLKERILSIARANGVPADDVKQVDQSKQTKRVSANVSGMLGTVRIALNDNLLLRADAPAVEAVMAHEIGHYVLNHAGKRILFFALVIAVCFAGTSWLFNFVAARRGERWGIRGVDDYAGFPLLFAAISVFLFLATPVLNKITYVQEYEADLYAINATQNPEAWAEVALLTSEYRKLHPPEWEENWLNHHPSPYARVYMAMRWKAENLPPTPSPENSEADLSQNSKISADHVID